MFNKNFDPQSDEDDAANDFDFLLEKMAKPFSDNNSDKTNGKSDSADNQCWLNYRNSQHAETDADSKGIYTRGNR